MMHGRARSRGSFPDPISVWSNSYIPLCGKRTAMTKITDTKTSRQRTPDQIGADLVAKIADVKKRAATKQAKQTDEGKALFAAAKALDKAAHAAAEAGNDGMRQAAESARAILSEAMIEMGVRVPEPGRRRRPKGAAA